MKKLLAILFTMLVLATMPVYAASVTDTLEEGESEVYTLNGENYEIEVIVSDHDSAGFSVNGRVSSHIQEGQQYVFEDDSVIGVLDINGDNVQFDFKDRYELMSYDIQSTIEEQHTSVYRVNGIQYEIRLIDINNDYVQFRVNDQLTRLSRLGTIFSFNDGSRLQATSIVRNHVTFLFKGGPEQSTPPGMTLSNYPYMFIKGSEFDGVAVVGNQAPASDVIAMTDIIQGLQMATVRTIVSNDGSSQVIRVQVGTAKLAGEVKDIFAQNLISVGTPCNNDVTYVLERKPSSCLEGLEPGQGVIKLYNRNGHYQLVVTGYSNEDVRKAAKVIANWRDYDLRGNIIYVTGTLNNPIVKTYKQEIEEETKPIEEEQVEQEEQSSGEGAEVTDDVREKLREALLDDEWPVPTCTDGIWNDGETGVDCGGPCRPCRPTRETCNGCVYDSTCLPFGTRLPAVEGQPSYCSIYKKFEPQKADGVMCQNNYECSSNSCSSGRCVDLAEELRKTQQEVRETRGLVEKILGWLGRWFR